MVATRTARRAAHNRSLPFLALWRRDDVTDSVVDFLPTPTIAVLPMVAKPLRAAQQRVLLTAIRRRGKTAPSPPTTRACLEVLGIPYLCEKWEQGLERWRVEHSAAYTVKPFRGGGSCLEIVKGGGNSINGVHRGLVRDIDGENLLLVTRFRVTVSLGNQTNAVGYVLLCGPGGDFFDSMGGVRFDKDRLTGVQTLVWCSFRGGTRDLCNAKPNRPYTVDAIFHHESQTTSSGSVDISVNGRPVVTGLTVGYKPLSLLSVYNFSSGRCEIGEIEVWYKAAEANQTWDIY